jgi:hypothetical protein
MSIKHSAREGAQRHSGERMNRKRSIKLFISILRSNLAPDLSQFNARGRSKPKKGFIIIISTYLAIFAALGLYTIMQPWQQWFQLLVLLSYDGIVIGLISVFYHIRKRLKHSRA